MGVIGWRGCRRRGASAQSAFGLEFEREALIGPTVHWQAGGLDPSGFVGFEFLRIHVGRGDVGCDEHSFVQPATVTSGAVTQGAVTQRAATLGCDGGLEPTVSRDSSAAEAAGAVQARVPTAAAVLGSSRSVTSGEAPERRLARSREAPSLRRRPRAQAGAAAVRLGLGLGLG